MTEEKISLNLLRLEYPSLHMKQRVHARAPAGNGTSYYIYQKLVPNNGILNRWQINLRLLLRTLRFPPSTLLHRTCSPPSSAPNQHLHPPPAFTLAREYSFHSVSFYRFAVHTEPPPLPRRASISMNAG